jgi:uncharacterized protein YjiS (DUF1127 family)
LITLVRTRRLEPAQHDRPKPWARLLDWLFTRRHRTAALERLSDHMLRDIGVLQRRNHRQSRQVR